MSTATEITRLQTARNTIRNKMVNLGLGESTDLLDDLADEVGIAPGYLSRLFKKETGMSVSEYITVKKVETAANMLKYAEYTPSQIANILAFSSQSYFVSVFKRYMGSTPGKYKYFSEE